MMVDDHERDHTESSLEEGETATSATDVESRTSRRHRSIVASLARTERPHKTDRSRHRLTTHTETVPVSIHPPNAIECLMTETLASVFNIIKPIKAQRPDLLCCM